MGDKAKKVCALTGCVTPESVKVVAESVCISDMPDSSLSFLADEMTLRLRHLVQVGLLLLLPCV